jgi:hypothetical protein
MSLLQLKNQIEKLKRSIILDIEPSFKVFILGKANSPTKEEIQAYTVAHPRTHVLKLTRKSYRKA